MTDEAGPASLSGASGWRSVLSATIGVMLVVALIMGFVLLQQVSNYRELLTAVRSPPGVVPNGALAPALSRSLDAAVIKTCSIFLAFLLVFLGGLYTLRVGDSAYRLSIEGGLGKGALETARDR